jgi:hypothetical protein
MIFGANFMIGFKFFFFSILSRTVQKKLVVHTPSTKLENMSSKIKYRIVNCSSFEAGYPPSELEVQGNNTKGWQSSRHVFCVSTQLSAKQLT